MHQAATDGAPEQIHSPVNSNSWSNKMKKWLKERKHVLRQMFVKLRTVQIEYGSIFHRFTQGPGHEESPASESGIHLRPGQGNTNQRS